MPATLALTLGTPASFGAFTPGSTQDYTASTTANVISTAGDAALSVSDPSTVNPGPPGQRRLRAAAAAAGQGPHGHQPGRRARAAPRRTLLTWAAPVSNDAVTVDFAQRINAVDALRTGAYAKTLTFTLSTTTP